MIVKKVERAKIRDFRDTNRLTGLLAPVLEMTAAYIFEKIQAVPKSTYLGRKTVLDMTRKAGEPRFKGSEVIMICLWCNRPETSRRYRPSKAMDFICSSCVQLLLGCSQEKLAELQRQCQAKGYDHKLEALRSFMEIGHEQRNPKNRKLGDRTCSLRTVRLQKKSTCTVKKRGTASFFENHQDEQAVSGV